MFSNLPPDLFVRYLLCQVSDKQMQRLLFSDQRWTNFTISDPWSAKYLREDAIPLATHSLAQRLVVTHAQAVALPHQEVARVNHAADTQSVE